MTVTPSSDPAPWDGGQGSYRPQPPAQPQLEPVRQRRGGRLRWLAAILATVLVLGLVAVVFLLANPPAAAGGISPLARFAPRDSAAYMEVRLDLPGDQRDSVISFMSNFPGFADPATFDQKISDTLDQILRSSQDEVGWKGDIEPWFGGQVVAVAGQLEGDQGTPQGGTLAFSVKDRAALESFLDRAEDHADYETSEYRGATIRTTRVAGQLTSFAALDDALLVSYRIEDMHSALDVNAGAAPGLTDEPGFEAAMARLTGDRLAAFYLDGEALVESIESSMGAMPLAGGPFASQLEQFPGTLVGQLRAAADHLVLEFRATARAGQSFPDVPQNRNSALVASFPADVLVYGEVRDLGAGIKLTVAQFVEAMAEFGMGAEGVDQMLVQAEQFLGTRPEDFLDFLADSGFALSADGDEYGGGIIAGVTDEDTARQRLDRLVTSLRTLLAFAGPDVPVTIEEQTHAGATLTVFRLRADMPGMGDLPFSSFSYTVHEGRLLMGTDDFVTSALDQSEADSLGSSPGFRHALEQAGETNGGFFYLNVGELRQMVEHNVPASERTEMAELWPFFERFSQLLGTVSSDGDELVTRLLLFVE